MTLEGRRVFVVLDTVPYEWEDLLVSVHDSLAGAMRAASDMAGGAYTMSPAPMPGPVWAEFRCSTGRVYTVREETILP